MDDTPDIAGFVDAQRRLRAELGEDVEFLQPLEVTFPDVPTDPETGEPYDPVIAASALRAASGSQGSFTLTCSVAFRPLSGDPAQGGAAGFRDRTHVMVAADVEARARCEPCTELVLRGERYKIISQKPDDALGNVEDRWLIFARRE